MLTLAYASLVLCLTVALVRFAGGYRGRLGVALGTSLFLCGIWVSLLVCALDLVSEKPLEATPFALWASAIVTLFSAQIFERRKGTKFVDADFWPEMIGLAAVGALYLSYFLVNSESPNHGWDALDHWLLEAARFIEHSATGDAPVFLYEHRHPRFLPLLTAAFANENLGAAAVLPEGKFVSLIFAWATAFVVMGFAMMLGLPLMVSIFLAILLPTIPLLENHMLIGGYAELAVTASMIVSVACSFAGISRGLPMLTAVGLLAAMCPLLLKNTGIAYSALAMSGPIGFWAMMHLRSHLHLLAALIFMPVLLAFSSDWSVILFGQALGYSQKTGEVFFASKSLIFSTDYLVPALHAAWHSAMVNSSYSVLPMATLISLVGLIRVRISNTQSQIDWSFLIVVLPLCFGILLLTLSLLSDYGFRYGEIGRDTGHSRFMLPIVIFGCLTVVLALSSLYSSVVAPQDSEKT